MHHRPSSRLISHHDSALVGLHHPAAEFLRSQDLAFEVSPQDPAILLVEFETDRGILHGFVHLHPDGDLLVFHLKYLCTPKSARSCRELDRLCDFLNHHLVTGRFCHDLLEGDFTFQAGHFFGTEGLSTRAFNEFFSFCIARTTRALPAVGLVANEGFSAAAALGALFPPSDS